VPLIRATMVAPVLMISDPINVLVQLDSLANIVIKVWKNYNRLLCNRNTFTPQEYKLTICSSIVEETVESL